MIVNIYALYIWMQFLSFEFSFFFLVTINISVFMLISSISIHPLFNWTARVFALDIKKEKCAAINAYKCENFYKYNESRELVGIVTQYFVPLFFLSEIHIKSFFFNYLITQYSKILLTAYTLRFYFIYASKWWVFETQMYG
jgi:hypothetical protein